MHRFVICNWLGSMVFEICEWIRWTVRQTDRQTDTFFTILSRAKVVINSEAVKAIKGDICKGAFI